MSGAKIIQINRKPKKCFVGQAPQSEGFYLSQEERDELIAQSKENEKVIFPFLVGRDLTTNIGGVPDRFVIDFGQKDIFEAGKFKGAFERIKNTVLPDVKRKAAEELENSGKKGDWNNHFQHWWWHWRGKALPP